MYKINGALVYILTPAWTKKAGLKVEELEL